MFATCLTHFQQHGRFCHPDWWAIGDLVDGNSSSDERLKLWAELCREWLRRTRDGLGGDYRVYETPNFHFLSTISQKNAEQAAGFFEQSIQKILRFLPGIASGIGEGKHLVMMLDDLDDYYEYIGHFYPDGDHPMSGGLCLRDSGYVHVVIPTSFDGSFRRVLVHEMTHVYLSHLALPIWLEESIAMRMEEAVCGIPEYAESPDIFERHRTWWDADSLQRFWRGDSWEIPGDSFELSYSLARLLWERIERGSPQSSLMDFIAKASWEDAGEQAYVEVFGGSLGLIAEEFLGTGDWAPQPEHWPK